MQNPDGRISLPIDPYLAEIGNTVLQNENVILTAPPGSGKTTRVPAEILSHYRQSRNNKKIYVLVPRRIAAISSANRICEENGWTLGNEVGYQVRFESRLTENTQLIFMTEGVFIKKMSDPGLWNKLDLIIFDEFHERSSHLDLILGIAFEKQVIEQNVKMLVMSATLDTTSLENYFGKSKLIEIHNKPYPLEIIKSKRAQKLICNQAFADEVVDTLVAAVSRSKKDILVFLPGLSEIRFIERQIQGRLSGLDINILHGSIKLDEQKKILTPAARRRVILATNIAESSITIPGVDCVIDSGLEKKSVSEAKIGFRRLETGRISLFSAKQRAGRAARTGPGICYQLWHEADEHSMPKKIEPEIVKSDLLEESLTLLSLNIENPDQFSWLDKPLKKFSKAFEQLEKWELIDERKKITPKGRLVQSCPLDIERSVLFVELSQQGYQTEAGEFLAFLETTDFSRIKEPVQMENLQLTDLGRRTEQQLNRLPMGNPKKATTPFRESLISVFFKKFPNKIARRKDRLSAVSSLGRGLEMAPFLVTPETDCFLLMAGHEISSSLTRCDFAVGFSKEEFEKLSLQNQQIITEVHCDFEKKQLYRIEKKTSGGFTVSEGVKSFVNESKEPLVFKDYFAEHFDEFLTEHEDYRNYLKKISFLRKKAVVLDYEEEAFAFLESLTTEALTYTRDTTASVAEFFQSDLFSILLLLTPEPVKKNLTQLPGQFTLPNGKSVKIDYESEQAPLISARIQDLLGQTTNPVLLNGQLRMTIELLGPNYRPAQITSQLENFWKTSYFDIRKELRSRYPRHAWPENPLEYVPEKKKY